MDFGWVVMFIMRSTGLTLSFDSEQVRETSSMDRLEQLADLIATESLKFLDAETLTTPLTT